MKLTELFGETPQMRYENIGRLKEKIRKWGRVFRWTALGLMALEIIIFLLLGAPLNNIIEFVVIGIPLVWFGVYLMGSMYGWGWYTVKAWLNGSSVSVGSVVSQTMDNALMSKFLTGRVTSGLVVSVLVLVLFLAIGIYAGIFNMIRYEGEYRKLKKQFSGFTSRA